jgi:iron complex transport system substrate-binding protein
LNRARHWRISVMAMAATLLAGAAPRAFGTPESQRQDVAQVNAGRVVTDEVGRQVRVPATVARIVTLAPDLTETIYALGLEDRLAGDTNYCDTPAAAKAKPHVGNPQEPSLEAIVALHPDLVLATTSINRVETADSLKRLGIAVYTSDPHTVRGMLDSISRMADLIGAAQQGAELVGRLQQRLDAVHGRLDDHPLVHVLFVVWPAPLQSIGQNTFIADALRWAGAESVVLSKQNWPRLSVEEVVRLQPDYIVFASDHGGTAATELSDLRARPAWRDLDAVEMGHVVDVSSESLRPSPGLVNAIEQLARELHPDTFSARLSIQRSKNGAQGRRPLLAASGTTHRCGECAL